MKYINLKYLILSCFIFCLAAVHAKDIKGVVVDEFSKPLEGVKVGDPVFYTLTDSQGKFELVLAEDQTEVTFSLKGYKSTTISTLDDKSLSITLYTDAHNKDEIIQLGYTSQTRNSLSGSVSTVSGEELARQRTTNITQTLSGNLLGLNYFEGNNNLFENTVGLVSRGIATLGTRNMLIVIDGVVCPTDDYKWLRPEEIESITLLKDASTTAIYGIQGSNGVLAITTKRGHLGKLKSRFFYNHSFQQMTKRPLFINSLDYATMRNQAAYNDNPSAGLFSQYSQEELDGFKSGIGYYPNNDWVGMHLKELVQLQQVGMDVSGGSERIRYYSHLAYGHQGSQFWTDNDVNAYNSQPNLNLFNARTNLDFNLNKRLSGFTSLSANMNRYRLSNVAGDNGGENSTLIYSRLQNLPPTIFGPTTESNGLGDVVTTDKEEYPVYGLLNRAGYNTRTSTNFLAHAGLKLDLDFLTEGLSITGSLAFQGTAAQLQRNNQDYFRKMRNLANGYVVNPIFSDIFPIHRNTALSNSNSGYFAYNLNYFANVNYQKSFDEHHINSKIYSFYLKQVLASGSTDVTVMPYNRHTTGLEVQYDFKNTYFAKFDLSYAGSDQFAPNSRYTWIPSISAAWVMSNEAFMENADYFSNLKFRASYGIAANDQIGNQRFLYLDHLSTGGAENLLGNPDIRAERVKNQNYGIDIGLFNAFSLSFDYFNMNNNNMLIDSRNLYPNFMGTSALSAVNQGIMNNKGWELQASYKKAVNQDVSFWIGAGVSFSENKVVYSGEIANAGYYQPFRRDGFGAASVFGYAVDYTNGNGFINNQEELARYKTMYELGGIGTPRLGDLIYKDLNNDGEINQKDMDYLGQGIPAHYYSLNGGMSYKSFELNFLLVGNSGAQKMMITQPNFMDGIFTDIHQDAWTAEKYQAGENISYPALYIQNATSNQASDFFLNNASFITLRNVELTYKLPENLTNKINANRMNLTLSGRNLFTIDYMKSKYVDPQVSNFYNFQPYRQFSLGVNLFF